MSTTVTTGLYEFDPDGTNLDNLIQLERQTLQTPGTDDFYFIIPHAAPFFVTSLEIIDDATLQPYVEGVDYVIGHYFVEAMTKTGRAIAGSIRFLDRSIGGVVRLKYQTLGGQWGFDDAAILAELSVKTVNPLTRAWAQVAPLPAAFPPVPHNQSVDDLIGFEEVVASVQSIADAIQTSDEGTNLAHIQSTDNPHQVTKLQVGLGQVSNYPITSDVDAANAVRSDLYMTPKGTRLAIDAVIGSTLTAHTDNLNNPHAVTKFQIGLGKLNNFDTAEESTARAMTATDLYITPKGVSFALDQYYQDNLTVLFEGGNPTNVTKEDVGLGNVSNFPKANVGQAGDATSDATYMTPAMTAVTVNTLVGSALSTHVGRTNNPHEVTAAQVGALTESEITNLLLGKLDVDGTAENANAVYGLNKPGLAADILTGKSADSSKLEGLTPPELRDYMAQSLMPFLSFDLSGNNLDKYIKIMDRPQQVAGDSSPLPSGHVSFLVTGRHIDGREAIIHLHVGEPSEAPTGLVINDAETDLELVTTTDVDDTQSLWFKSPGSIENINVIVISEINPAATILADTDAPDIVDTLPSAGTPVVVSQMLARIENDIASAFEDATATLTT